MCVFWRPLSAWRAPAQRRRRVSRQAAGKQNPVIPGARTRGPGPSAKRAQRRVFRRPQRQSHRAWVPGLARGLARDDNFLDGSPGMTAFMRSLGMTTTSHRRATAFVRLRYRAGVRAGSCDALHRKSCHPGRANARTGTQRKACAAPSFPPPAHPEPRDWVPGLARGLARDDNFLDGSPGMTAFMRSLGMTTTSHRRATAFVRLRYRAGVRAGSCDALHRKSCHPGRANARPGTQRKACEAPVSPPAHPEPSSLGPGSRKRARPG